MFWTKLTTQLGIKKNNEDNKKNVLNYLLGQNTQIKFLKKCYNTVFGISAYDKSITNIFKILTCILLCIYVFNWSFEF